MKSFIYNVNMNKKLLKIIIGLFLALSAFSPYCIAQDEPLSLKEQGLILYNTNNIEEAYKVLSKIPEAEKDAQTWLLLANIAQDYGKDLDAIFLLQKAIQKDPCFYRAYYNLGNLYFKDEKIYMAIGMYQKAIKYNEDFAYAYFNLGNCYLAQKKYSQAKYNFNKAINLKNDEPDFYYNMAFLHKEMKKDKQAQVYLNIYNTLMEKKLN